ncbi:MAG: flagellar hook-basal body complex protein FliE [Planctomycetes bacterium]|nr:flagellar hook-basal body complex protein FliE [Planctomycetota bacterium]
MINLNANIGSILPNSGSNQQQIGAADNKKSGFSETIKALEKSISSVDESQQASDMSVKDLLTGQNNDITSVVAAAAKADMSFKLLVGVRNKLIEAYKQTMNMPL